MHITCSLNTHRDVHSMPLACSLFIALFLASVAAEPRPNVVLFLTDDQGTLDIKAFGAKDLITPNMDEIAERGIRFTQSYAHTVCCPARALLMTGRHPQRSGVNNWTQGNMKDKTGRNMDLEEVTIAEVLRAAGYRTGLFGKWHLGAAPTHGPTKQGFDEFFGHRGGFIDNYNHFFLHGLGFHDLYSGTDELFLRDKYFPDLMTNEALGFIERNRERAFFMVMAFNLPHYPEQHDAMFEEPYKHLPMPRRSYARVLSTTDDRIGRVLSKLDDLGLRENTMILFMSDNGASTERNHIRMNNHKSGLPKGHKYGANGGGGFSGKWRGHKGTFYEGGIRTPAMISFPGRIATGEARDQAITAADFMPTILDYCGVELPKVKLDGQSLRTIIEKPESPTHHKVMHWQWSNRWAVREGNWKLISGRRPELVSLEGDMPESKNLASQHPEIVNRLTGLHNEWTRDVFSKHPVQAQQRRPAKPPKPARLNINPTSESLKRFTNHGVGISDGKDKAWTFNGKGQYLDLKNSELPNPTGLAISISARIRADSPDGVVIAQGGQSQGFSLYLKERMPCFAIRSGSRGVPVNANRKLPDGWVDLKATLSRTKEITISVNGERWATGKAAGVLSAMPGDGLQIGADTISAVGDYLPENHFKGMIKDVNIEFSE